MKFNIANHFTLIGIFLMVILVLGPARIGAQKIEPTADKPKTNRITKDEKKEIEAIVREYLIKNPSIIREAMLALQIKEAKEKRELAAKNLKTFEKEIFADPNTPTAGSEKADISVVVFFDYNCGYCKSSLPMLNEILANDSSVRIVYKEYPILAQSSQLGAKAALAAGRQGKYLEFHNVLVKTERINEESIKTIVNELGLNYERFEKDMNGGKLDGYLANNYKLAESLNIEGTPAYIIGTQIIPGAIDITSLKIIIEEERAKISKAKKLKGSTLAN